VGVPSLPWRSTPFRVVYWETHARGVSVLIPTHLGSAGAIGLTNHLSSQILTGITCFSPHGQQVMGTAEVGRWAWCEELGTMGTVAKAAVHMAVSVHSIWTKLARPELF
jgi:hypothetical protein